MRLVVRPGRRAPVLATPPGVRAYERRGHTAESAGLRLLFLTNEGEEPREVTLDGTYQDLLDGGETSRAVLPPAGVKVLKKLETFA